MRLIIFFPIFTTGLFIGYFVLWVYVAMHIYSVGDPVDNETPSQVRQRLYFPFDTNDNPENYTSFEMDDTTRGVFAFHIFAGLWNTQFLIYLTYFVIAGAIADWCVPLSLFCLIL